MENYNPFYQLEVRYSPILNFTSFNKTLIAPYVKLTNRIGVENENTFKESFQLISDEDNFMIVISWDRMYLRSQGNIEDMIVDNSIIEQLFFSLLDDIKKKENFGKIENFLLFVSSVNIDKDANNANKQVIKFADQFISEKSKKVLDSFTDGALELVKKDDEKEISLLFGPYFGLEDLKKRKAQPPFEVKDFDLDRTGQMAEIKIYEKNSNFDFQKFKELVSKYKEYYGRLF